MRMDTNATRCFRLGPVIAVTELQVNDSNFPALHSEQTAQRSAKLVIKKKSGYTMNLSKVQDSKVTTFSASNPTRGGSARPHQVLGAWIDSLPDEEVSKGFRRMTKTTKKPLPTTHSASILMKAPKGVNNMGQNMWWEEVELWVTCKGRESHLLSPPKQKEYVLVPSVNQVEVKQGLVIDRVVWERRELGKPAARLQFFPQHK